jgi:hypothetical protein
MASNDHQTLFQMKSRSTFEWHFPVVNFVIRYAPVIIFASSLIGIAALILGGISAGLSVVLMALGLLGLWIDRDWLRVWPSPPMVWFALVCVFSGGVGPLLLLVSGEQSQTGDLDQMQVGMALGAFVFFVAYGAMRPAPSRVPIIADMIVGDERLRASLVGACPLFFAFAAVESAVGAISGASDRGLAGEAAAHQVFGYWSYFVAFNRLGPVAFLLAPLAWRFSNIAARVFIVGTGGYVVFMGGLSGSRHLVFTPIVMLLIGYVAFTDREKVRAEIFVLISIPLALATFIFLDHFRNTDTFQRESLADPFNRVRAIAEARSRAQEQSDLKLYLLGERLVGVIDPLVYQATPSIIPHAEFDGVDALLWIYIPSFFYPGRPSLIDAPKIGEQYLQQALVRTSVGPSFTGDWYRRFGWGGVVIGMGAVGVFLGFSMRGVVWALLHIPQIGLAIVLLASTFATKDANMTVATAIWVLFYDFPKYILALLLCFVLGRMIAPIVVVDSLHQRVNHDERCRGRERFRPRLHR